MKGWIYLIAFTLFSIVVCPITYATVRMLCFRKGVKEKKNNVHRA